MAEYQGATLDNGPGLHISITWSRAAGWAGQVVTLQEADGMETQPQSFQEPVISHTASAWKIHHLWQVFVFVTALLHQDVSSTSNFCDTHCNLDFLYN